MLYDLNIPHNSSSDLSQTLAFASHLGYSVLALTTTLSPPIPATIPPPPPLPPLPPNSNLTLLTRATIPISDPATNHRLPQVAATYDLVALRPTTQFAFLAACTSLSSDHFSLISLDLTASLSFHFPPRTCMAAVARGLRFEICYGQFLGAAREDSRARSNFISNVAGLIRATKGRGVVVSSEARGAMGLRAPADVVNLMAVWGMGADRGKEAMGAVARGVVVNEGLRRRGFRGVVDVIAGAGTGREKGEGAEGMKGKGRKGGKDKGGGQKRRGEEVEDGVQGDDGPPASKRQAKKMRLALKEKEKAEKA